MENTNIENLKKELRMLVSEAACAGCSGDSCHMCSRDSRYSKKVNEIFDKYMKE